MDLPASLPASLHLFRTRTRRTQAGWAALCAVLICLVAVADVLTGYEMSLSILYLVPVLLATWTLGFATGIAFVVFAIATWVVSVDFMGHVYRHPFYEFWDGAIRFVTWSSFAWILERLKLALASADERFVTVLARLDAAVYVADAGSGKLLYTNEYCRKAFGGEVSDAAGIAHRLHARGGVDAPPPEGAAVQTEVQDSVTGNWYLLAAREIRWIDGRSVSLHIATDVTDRKHAEDLARQQQQRLEMVSRLTTLGEMASTLAHEINQPLAAIANYCGGCARRLRSGEWRREDLLEAMEKSAAQAERAAGIIHRVREFLGQRKPGPGACDLNAVISAVAHTIAAEAERRGARLRFEPDARLPRVFADGIMIEQVVLNLVKNGLEAMQLTPATAREVAIRTATSDQGRVTVEIADRGSGLPERLRDNLFVPFYTTKQEGMGLGLHICRSIVERHGGRLTAASNPAGGTVFRFTLPAAST